MEMPHTKGCAPFPARSGLKPRCTVSTHVVVTFLVSLKSQTGIDTKLLDIELLKGVVE